MASDLTKEQYEKAIGLAMRDGNKPAMDALLEEYSQAVTGPANFMGKLGAGFEDVRLAGKQMLGMTTPDEIKQHNKFANQATGGTIGGHLTRALPLAMTALLPGGQRVGGAAAYGALSGLMTPTEDENVLAGKMGQAVVGGLTGGAVQQGFNMAAPVLKKALSKARDFLPGGQARVAARDFVETIPEAERAAAQQTLEGATAARQAPMAAGTSGAPISTAAALGAASKTPGQFSEGTAKLLSAEREAREAGGMIGQPFRNLDEQAAQTRWQHLEQNVGGDVPALAREADDVYQNFVLNAKLRKEFDPHDKLMREFNTAIADEVNPAAKSELTRIADQYANAKIKRDFKTLHATRMEAFDDAQKRLYQTDSKAANRLGIQIQELKDIFDKEMETALGGSGKWSQFRQEYSAAKTAQSQAQRGEDFLGTARTWAETPGGVPQLTGKRQQMGALADEVTDYGRPAVSPAAGDALRTVRREIGQQMLPQAVGAKGSATAMNLNPTSSVLSRALTAQRRANQGLLAPENLGAMALLEPVTALGGIAGMKMLDRRALGIAEQLMKLYTDPAQAAQALANAKLPPQVKQLVMVELGKRMGAQGAAGAAVQQMDQPQEQ